MKCVICKHDEVGKNRTTLTFEKSGTTMILKDVLCDKCEQCGEVYLSEDITKEVMAIVDRLSKARSEFNVYKFDAA